MRLLLGLTLSASIWGQEIATRETLLRERINEFWKSFESGQYRKADLLVQEEDKDAFFSWPKKKIFKIETSQVKFTEDGKVAEVMTPVETDEFMVGVGQMRITRPVLTYWKLADNTWWWYLPKNIIRDTPFGPMNLGGADALKNGSVRMPASATVGPTAADLWKKVLPNKTELQFQLNQASSGAIEFKNDLPGAVGLLLDVPAREEFQVSVSPKEIPRGGVGVVTVKFTPTPPGASVPLQPGVYELRVTVAQTGKTHTIRLRMEDPAKAAR